MSRYTDRYRTPSPLFPKASPTSLARLLQSWETLRELDTHGYRTSAAVPASTWLVKIAWAESHTSGRSQGRGTTCSPFVTQSVAMAYSVSNDEPYQPMLADGSGLPNLFSSAANGALRADNRCHQRLMARYGMTMADNEWPRPIIFFNMGYAVELEQMRRGDAVHIDWMNGQRQFTVAESDLRCGHTLWASPSDRRAPTPSSWTTTWTTARCQPEA